MEVRMSGEEYEAVRKKIESLRREVGALHKKLQAVGLKDVHMNIEFSPISKITSVEHGAFKAESKDANKKK